MFRGSVEPYVSKIDTRDPQYSDRYGQMRDLVNELQGNLQKSLFQGRPEVIERHQKAGKLLARDRVEMVLDEDSPFLELCPLAGWGQKGIAVGGSVVAGIGVVCGIECMITANVSTIKGGSMNETGVLKGKRIAEIAFANRLPVISFVQSGGADLTQQSKVFHMGGGAFRELAMRSKAGIPTITVVFGSSTAGGAYTPGMSDYVIMVKDQAKVFLGGPPLVKMAIGEDVDDESLGGATMHSKISGVSDFLAEDEFHALHLVRSIVTHLNRIKNTTLPISHFTKIEDPIYPIDEILGIVGGNIRVPFDAKEVIARVVDGSRFTEFKPLYGSTLVCCFGNLHGIPVGILANNGVLFQESAQKGAQFISLCNQSNIPLIFLQNITGFMVGKKVENSGIIKYGSLLINAVSNSGVPAITVVMGASYGAGNYGMCGRSYAPRFLFSWPNSRCAVMGSEQLSGVLDIVFRQGLRGMDISPEMEAEANRRKKAMNDQIEIESNVYVTSGKMIDDAVIDPRDTRHVIGMCLSVIYNAEVKGANLHGVSRL